MLNFPALPETLTSRQITCISCGETFTIAEDYAVRNSPHTRDWRLVPDRYPDQYPDTELRYQTNRSRRPATPEQRAEPARNPVDYLDWDQSRPALVNCPRCGVDNRNWLHILSTRPPWWRQTILVPIGLALILVLSVAIFFRSYEDVSVGQQIIMFIAIFLVGFLPLQTITRGWRRLREFNYSRSLRKLSFFKGLSPPLTTWLYMVVFFLFILPLILYVLVPWGFHTAFTLLAEEDLPEPSIETRIVAVMAEVEGVMADSPPQNTLPLELALADLVDFLEINQLPVAQLEGMTLSEKTALALNMTRNLAEEQDVENWPLAAEAVSKLETFADVNQIEADAGNVSDDSIPEWFSVTRDFLGDWFQFGLFSSIVGIFFGWLSVDGFIRRVNRHLPPPIYHSIASMTRVVVWEANRSLEIGNAVYWMQWTGVDRNARGGIDLQGIHRDEPPDGPDHSLLARVNAHYYRISSDRWGRIENAEITAVRVPAYPRRAESSLANELFVGQDVHAQIRDDRQGRPAR